MDMQGVMGGVEIGALESVETMRAVMQDRYGSAEVLRLGEVGRPTPSANEVLVRVRAAGVDRGVWHLMAGRPYLMRIMGFGFSRPKDAVRGRELAGVVVEVGSAVTRFKAGDEVFGIGEGSFAEFVAAREDKLARKPAGCTFEQAAVTAVSGLTALHAVRDSGHVAAGQRVLVIGASGGVGSFAVQIAKSFGAEVTGVARGSKADFVRSLGADAVIDYTTADFADGSQQYDVIIDTGGNTPVKRLRRALTPRGTLVIVGGEGGSGVMGGLSRQFGAAAASAFVPQTLTMLLPEEKGADI